MDADLKERLKELSRNVTAVGRMIGSTRLNLSQAIELKEILDMSSETLDTYIRIQTERYLDVMEET